MKKLLLCLLFAVSFLSYAQQYVTIVSGAGTSTLSRAPQGTQRYTRTCYIIPPSEIAASGLPNASILSAISFEYSVAQDLATTGTFKVYLQNTTDATYLKTSTTWTDVITGMTLAHDAPTTIPAATGFWNIPFVGGSPFTYTGGGMYVAFEYENATGAIALTANTALCNNSLATSLRNATSTTAMPTVLGATASAFRPNTRFAFPATCILPTNPTVSTVTTTSANVTFTAPTVSPANGYEYVLSTSATAPTAATPATATAMTTSIALSSLLPTTTYYLWLRSVCSTTSRSVWSLQPFIFHTASVAPYNTGFEVAANQNLFEIHGWANQATGNTGTWVLHTDTTAPFYADAGVNCIRSAFFTDAAYNAYMFSRPIAMTGGVLHQITYKYRVLADATVTTTTIPLAFRVVTNTTNTSTGVNVLTTKTGVNNLTYITETLNFTPATTGTYYIGYHNNSPIGTGATTNNILFVDTFSVTAQLSNDKFDSSSISIFPNPATDVLNVTGVEGITSLVINDINGRTIKTVNDASSINISELNAGVYFVNIATENGNVTKKFMKN